MTRRRGAAFTLVEILVSIAILVILFGLMFRPLMMGMEVLSIGRGEQRSQELARQVTNQLTADLQGAVLVYPNFATYKLSTGPSGTNTLQWRTPQTQRLDLVLPARDAQGNLLTPVRPAFSGDPQHPLVVTYWRMRKDVTQDYDPLSNPYRLYRSTHAYNLTSAPQVGSPDGLWNYALSLNAPLDGASGVGGMTQLTDLFKQGGPFDWFIADLDVKAPAFPNKMLLRAPVANMPYSNAQGMDAITALTDAEADVRDVQFMPVLVNSEELRASAGYVSYRAQLARWVTPYQRETDGLWTLPASDLVPRSGSALPLPVVATFRAHGARSPLLGGDYFVSIEQDTASPLVGHPILYRLPANAGDPPVRVYDLVNYPTRVFKAAPGNPDSGEFACGLDWANGQLTTAFPQVDVICPAVTAAGAPDANTARIHAQNDPAASTGGPTPPLYQGGSALPTTTWQSLPLTYRDAAGAPVTGVNGASMDDFVLDAAGAGSGLWDSYTLSVFRPQRLQTGTDQTLPGSPSQGDRTLDMSVIPNSEQVVVEQFRVGDQTSPGFGGSTSPTLINRRVYTPVRTLAGGTVNAGSLGAFRYYLDPTTGRLTFYDPQLDPSTQATVRDGLNPPAVVPDPDPAYAGQWLVPVITVSYQYRNNLPTTAQLQLGDDSSRDVVQATYRSLQSIQLQLTIDVPTESTRGDTEVIQDPLATSAIERPTGARKRVTVQTVVAVGSNVR